SAPSGPRTRRTWIPARLVNSSRTESGTAMVSLAPSSPSTSVTVTASGAACGGDCEPADTARRPRVPAGARDRKRATPFTRRLVRTVQLRGHPHQVGQRAGLHLPHDVAALDLHGDLARSQLGGDLLVQQARDDEGHHLAFARRQRQVALAQRPQRGRATAEGPMAIDRLPDAVQQLLAGERLAEELDRARLHGPDRAPP